MEPVEGWILEKNTGSCYRLLINDGPYASFVDALMNYNGPWYLIRTSYLTGTEEEIIARVNDDHRVSVTAKWKRGNLLSLQITDKDKNVVITDKDIRIFQKIVYKS